MRSSPIRPVLALLLTLCAAGTLGACSAPAFIGFPPQTRGNKVDPELLAQLVPGTSSRADVTALIGTPTTKATFDDNTWIYIGEVTRPLIGGTLKVHDQEVVEMHFDEKGVLRSMERKGSADSLPVSIASGATASPGNNASILQQLLGNVGRFNPGGASPGTPQNTIGGVGPNNSF